MQREQGFEPPKETEVLEKKLFLIKPGSEMKPDFSVYVISRDTGSANALIPVVNGLLAQNCQITVLAEGPAESKFENAFSEANTRVGLSDDGTEAINNTDLILSDASSSYGLEGCVSWGMRDKPFVLVEDNYSSSTAFLEACARFYGHIPDRICVMDEEAKKIIVNQYPELENHVVITGQPIYDQIADEDTEKIQIETKQKLGLEPDEKLVVFMGTVESTLEPYKAIFQQVKDSDFTFGFRKHPYCVFSYAEIYALMDEAGVKYVPMDNITIDQAGAAADLVMTTWSTEGVKGIYREKPTIHILDADVLEMPDNLSLPLPPVALGASIEVNHLELLKSSIEALLDSDSTTRQELDNKMRRYYPSDGKNTQRVIAVINQVMGERRAKQEMDAQEGNGQSL